MKTKSSVKAGTQGLPGLGGAPSAMAGDSSITNFLSGDPIGALR
jgi:hypothetical protein